MKKILILVLATFAFAQTLCAYKLNNVALNGARWRSYPVSLQLNPANSGLPSKTVLAVIQQDMEKWNTAVGFEALAVSRISDSVAAANVMDVDGINAIGFSISFKNDSNGFDPKSAVAIAGQYGDGYTMSDAFLLFNSEYVSWYTDDTQSSIKRGYTDHLPTIALHELGHVLGLGHSEVASAIMAAVRQTKIETTLTDDDIAGARYVTGIDTTSNDAGSSTSTDNNTSSSMSGGCATITTNSSGGSNGGNISGNAAIMLLPMLALLFIRRRAAAFNRQ